MRLAPQGSLNRAIALQRGYSCSGVQLPSHCFANFVVLESVL